MISRADAKFWKRYNALPTEVRELADKCFALFAADPQHSSLHFKPLNDETWAAQVGAAYRALAVRDEDAWLWIWIGSHEEYNGIVRQLRR